MVAASGTIHTDITLTAALSLNVGELRILKTIVQCKALNTGKNIAIGMNKHIERFRALLIQICYERTPEHRQH